MKTLVTGATGFVGKAYLKVFGGCRCVVREGERNDFADSFVVSNIDGATDWSNCFKGVNAIIHLAGVAHNKRASNQDYRSVNTEGTLHLAREAAKCGVKRFVFVSSIGVNGTSTQDKPFMTTSVANPHNAYAKSKYEAEIGLKKISEDTGLEVVIVRPTLVYGLNAPGNFGMLLKLVSKLPILPFGLANNRRDFIAVQNLVDLLDTCATHPDAAGQTFLASDTETVSTKSFTNAIAKGLDKKVIQLPVPVSLMRLVAKLIGKSAMIEQLFGNLEVDSSNIKQVLGWTPTLTIEQAMALLKDSDK